MEKEENIKGKVKLKKRPKESLKYKVIGLTLVIVVAIVAFFEIFTISSLKRYYYGNLNGVLYTQCRQSADLYLSNFGQYDLQNIVVNNRNAFYRNNLSQVQLLNNAGVVVYDSLATEEMGKKIETEDVEEAILGKSGSYIGQSKYQASNVMSVSYPLTNQNTQIGIIRLSSTLSVIDGEIRKQSLIYLIFGGGMIIFSAIMSIILADSITKPINKLNDVANKIADGNYSYKADENMYGEIGQLAKSMNIMSGNIIEKDNLKNEFISSVSHELRTPLTSIKGWSLTLQSNNLDKEVVDEGLKIIEKESDRLSMMVEELLDFSRFKSNRVTLVKETFDIVEVTDKILTQLTPKFNDGELYKVLDYSSESIMVNADPSRIKQVLINIIDNAIKFTKSGGTVFVDVVELEDVVEISIIDTGIGISEDEINLVTEKFYKGSDSNSHTGLGLSISEEIVKAHGGELSISSKEGIGTTVKFTIPKGGEV